MPSFSRLVSAALIMFFVQAQAEQQPMELVIQIPEASQEQYQELLRTTLQRDGGSVSRYRVVKLDIKALDTDFRSVIPDGQDQSLGWVTGNPVKFTAFDNESMILTNTKVNQDEGEIAEGFKDWWSWIGHVDGDETSFASFVIANNQIQGGFILSAEHGTFEISTLRDDLILIRDFSSPTKRNVLEGTSDQDHWLDFIPSQHPGDRSKESQRAQFDGLNRQLDMQLTCLAGVTGLVCDSD